MIPINKTTSWILQMVVLVIAKQILIALIFLW